MPTYRNDTAGNIVIENINGQIQSVAPAGTVESYIVGHSVLTLVSDDPYYNPIIERHSVSSTGAADPQEVELSGLSGEWILIDDVTGGPVTVYLQSTSNTPAVAVLSAGESFVCQSGNKADALVLTFDAAGTCTVTESLEEIKGGNEYGS